MSFSLLLGIGCGTKAGVGFRDGETELSVVDDVVGWLGSTISGTSKY